MFYCSVFTFFFFYSVQKRVLEPQLWSGCFALWNELTVKGVTVEVLESAVTQAPQLLSRQWDSIASCSCLSLRFRFSLIVKPLGGQSLKGVYGTPSDATRPLHTICH